MKLKKTCYSEIAELNYLLEYYSIPHQIESIYEGYRIGYPSICTGNTQCVFIQYPGTQGLEYRDYTHGREENKIEKTTYLTGREAYNIILTKFDSSF